MTKLMIGGAMAAATIAIVPAIAQPAPPPPPGVAQGTAPVAPVPGVPRIQVRTEVHRMMMPETRAEVVVHVRETFAKLDTNRDGFVTREEAEAAHKLMGGEMHDGIRHRNVAAGMSGMDRNAMFDRFDTNHDGMISRQEFAERGHVPGTPEGPTRMTILRDEHAPGGTLYRREVPMRMGGHMFDMADANRDGRVSLQEMTDAALRHFDMADANHDGRISPDERMQMHQRIKEMKRPA